MEQDIILKALIAIRMTGDDVVLAVETIALPADAAGNVRDVVRASLRGTMPNGRTCPLFDPDSGEYELAGYADAGNLGDDAAALSMLRRVLGQYKWEA